MKVYHLSRIFLLGALIIHLTLASVYFYCKLPELGLFSAIFSIVYLIFFKVIKMENIRIIICMVTVEVMIYILLNIMTFGWNYYLYIYSFAIISLCILASISAKHGNLNVYFPSIIFIVSHVILLVVRIYTWNNPVTPPEHIIGKYDMILTIQGIVNYVFVSILLFVMLLGFMIDLNDTNAKLESIGMKLVYISTHDVLTKLLNRRSMNEILNEELTSYDENTKKYTLIMADIDDFKKVNDTYGHNMGDYVLQRVSDIIVNSCNTEKICRWGGEEILILVEDNGKEACKLAEKIRKNIETEKFIYNGNEINVTLTLGVAEYKKGMSVSHIIDLADGKLYEGKQSTKNCVIV